MISRRQFLLSIPASGALLDTETWSMFERPTPTPEPTALSKTWNWTKSLGMTYDDFLTVYGMYTWEYSRYWWSEDFYTMWVTFSPTTIPIVTSLELEADDFKYFTAYTAEKFQEEMLPIDSQFVRTREKDGTVFNWYESAKLAEASQEISFDYERYRLDYIESYETIDFAKKGQFQVSVEYKDGSKKSEAIHSVKAWIVDGTD